MQQNHRHTIEDIKNYFSYKNKSSDNKNSFYREFLKKDDKFIARDKFFISEEIDDGKIAFIHLNLDESKLNYNNNSVKFLPYFENLDIYINSNNKKYIDLIVISNISLKIDDLNINKHDLIKKFINSNNTIEDKLLEDLYFNNDFSKKINIELPEKYGSKKFILEECDISKKYLFKIDFSELNFNLKQHNNYIIKNENFYNNSIFCI
jgi:hypothetical protein